MRLMMLMAMLAIVAKERPVVPTVPAVSQPGLVAEASPVRLLVRGGTAQWSFQFACAGAHWRFRHTHVLHRFRQAQYMNLAVRFSGVPDHQGDAAVWLQRVSATRESAEGN